MRGLMAKLGGANWSRVVASVAAVIALWPGGHSASAGVGAGLTACEPGSDGRSVAVAPETPLIPRAVLMGDADLRYPMLSPDGRMLAFMSAEGPGPPNIWCGPLGEPGRAVRVTREEGRGVRQFWWAYTSRHLLYFREAADGLSWRLISVDIDTGRTVDLTRRDGLQPRLVALGDGWAESAVVAVNDRAADQFDLYAVGVADGVSSLLKTSPAGMNGWVIDRDQHVRYGVSFGPDGSQVLSEPGPEGEWTPAIRFGPRDSLSSGALAFGRDGRTLYLIDSRDRKTSALVALDTLTGRRTELASDPAVDLDDVTFDPVSGKPDAVSFRRMRQEWRGISGVMRNDFRSLAGDLEGDLSIAGRSLDDRVWLVTAADDDGPARTYAYYRRPGEKSGGHVELVLTSGRRLEGLPLAAMESVVIPARDGLELVSYLTRPTWPGSQSGPAPLVVVVHPGPWARDTWGYNPIHQLLANRGYAVLSVNFRGSTGFGKDHVGLSAGQWGAAMTDDLEDAATWAVDRGIADPARLAVIGSAYGGYAAMSAITRPGTPFACAVSQHGPLDLERLLDTLPPHRHALRSLFRAMIADETDPAGRAILSERSPVHAADRAAGPVLLAYGSLDPRGFPGDARAFCTAARAAGVPARFVEFPDEGIGLSRMENSLAFFALVEQFLADHLGGRAEPAADALAASSARVTDADPPQPDGDDEPGLTRGPNQEAGRDGR